MVALISGLSPQDSSLVWRAVDHRVGDDALVTPAVWARVRGAVVSHGLAPRMAAHAMSHPPLYHAEVAAQLRDGQHLLMRRNLLLVRQLVEITATLEAAGIPCAVLKGPGLAVRAYGNVAGRVFSDLDVLVEVNAIPDAGRVLERIGYQGARSLTPLFLSSNHQVNLCSPNGPAPLELHWETALRHYGVRASARELLQRRSTLVVAGKPLPCLCAADEILYLAVHGARHEWRRVEWLVAFARCAEADSEALEEAVTESRRVGLVRVLGLGLSLANRFELVTRLLQPRGITADPALPGLESRVIDRLSRPLVAPLDEDAGVAWFWIASQERFLSRALVLLRLAVRPTERDEVVVLPSRLTFLYYLVRPIRLSLRKITTTWRRAPADLGLLLRAFVLLVAMRCALWLAAFPRVARATAVLGRPRGNGPSPTPERLASAVRRASRVVPGASCLTQALAAQVLIGRTGVVTEIRWGVREARADGIEGHAWLDLDGVPLIGGDPVKDFVTLRPRQL